MKLPCVGLLLIVIAGCTHSDAFTSSRAPLGPFATGTDARLTLNVDQDYWPNWTQDGKGILYAYVDQQSPLHRCMGMLPPAGGTRIWQLCDNRAVRTDSASSYVAFALDTTGRLLAAEAVAPIRLLAGTTPTVTLWLADTATPLQRTTLLTLPVTAGSMQVTWLADLQWTGPNTFLALAQQFATVQGGVDSLFATGGEIVSGTIANGHATLSAIAGTDSATSYSLAESGTSLVFTVPHDLRLFTVPVGGGMPVPMPMTSVGPDTASQITGALLGVTCRDDECLVARDAVLITGVYIAILRNGELGQSELFFQPLSDSMELRTVNLSTGDEQVALTATSLFASPMLSPVSNDVVIAVGGAGHIESAMSGHSDLYLLRGILP
jgi:hypothetical protein